MVAVLLATCLPLTVFGANEELLPLDNQTTENTIGEADALSVSENTSVSTGDVIGEYVEDISRREENVKHFALPDGTYTAIVYHTAVHRKDADGAWQDINNDLTLSSVGGSEKFATFDSRVSFSSRFSPSSELMTLSENGYSILMSLLSESKNDITLSTETQTFALASVTNSVKKELPKTDVKLEDVAKVDNKSSIVYNNVRANTDFEYILDGNDVKENIIVKAPLSEYEYSFDLRLGGLVAILNENGSISINDAETGAGKYKIPAPYMYDANGEVSYAVEYTLIEVSSGRYLLIITADKTWINADGREFPVTIDPTIESLDPKVLSSDTYISQFSPETNYCASQNLVVGEGYTALIAPYLPNLPDTTIFLQAELYFSYCFDTNFPEVTTIGVYQITSDWSETETTYDNGPSTAAVPIDTVGLAVDQLLPNCLGTSCFNVSELVIDWYCSNATNKGMAIKHESGMFNVNIKSYDSGTSTCEFLSIKYTENWFEEGVYAFENHLFDNRWVTVSNGMIEHTYFPQSPVDLFESDTSETVRASLFKISQKTDFGHYVIRSMVDNRMGIGVEDGLLVLKSLPVLDEDVSYDDTFNIYSGEFNYVLQHCKSSMFVIVEDVDMPVLSLSYQSSAPNKIYWNLDEYNGTQNGCDIGIDSLSVGKPKTISARGWSTAIGYNYLYLCPNTDLYPYTTADISLPWDGNTSPTEITSYISGPIHLWWGMMTDSEVVSTPYCGNITIEAEPIIPSGTYFVMNQKYEKYLQLGSSTDSVGDELFLSYATNKNHQKWDIYHIKDNQYYITSVQNDLGVSIDANKKIIQNTESPIWTIMPTQNGYVISASSSEYIQIEYNDSTTPPALLIVAEPYIADNDYNDEWQFFRAVDNDIVLIGIKDSAGEFNNTGAFSDIMSHYENDTNTGFGIVDTEMLSRENFKSELENARIVVSRCHGNIYGDESYLVLNGSNIEAFIDPTSNYVVSAQEISRLDLSACELIIFSSCHSGDTNVLNLVEAAKSAGAQAAIGFKGEIYEDDLRNWTDTFFAYYCHGYSVGAIIDAMYFKDGDGKHIENPHYRSIDFDIVTYSERS